jgi:hypothetical protein
MAVTLSAALNALASTSAPDKVIVLEGSTAKQTAPENVGGDGYLKYVALLTQSGTSAPTATVLENTLGGTVVWGYTDVGVYTATLASVFTANKTAVFLSGNGGLMGSNIDSTSQITIYSNNSGGQPENEYIQTAPIEIRVYP